MATRITRLRQARYLTQVDLAKAAGLHAVSLAHRNRRDRTPRHHAAAACKALGVPPAALLG